MRIHMVSSICVAMLVVTSVAHGEDQVDFVRDVAPIFQQHCIRCHSPNIKKGDISLATIEDLEDQGQIEPGDPGASHLLEMITPSDNGKAQMPQEGAALKQAEVALIRQWVKQGAKWPEKFVLQEKSKAGKDWWALQPLSGAQPPAAVQGFPAAWAKHPIDRFVARKLAEKQLEPSPPATRRELIRRATYDLTGLPPTPEDVAAFIADEKPGAFARVVDRLLASPRYGERWGRHWLDVVRFGESNGFERNVIINNLWPFRDYVIRSFNEDKPFDRFIHEHLAGDVLAPGDPAVVTGSAFLVAGPYDNVGNQDAVASRQIRANTIDEMIRATSQAFLGLTVGCARCHNHKFDPILQADYYAMYATFAGVRHGSRVIATPQQQAARSAKLKPLNDRRIALTSERNALNAAVLKRAKQSAAEFQKKWTRPPVSRTGTEEKFTPVTARFVRLVSRGQDAKPANRSSFTLDEFEIWSTGKQPQNVALASSGAKASGPSRQIADFPGAYGPQLAIDGKAGRRFLATGGHLTVQLPKPVEINRVVFSSARGEATPGHRKFVFVCEYNIDVSTDGETWRTVATGDDRKPVNNAHRDKRLSDLARQDKDRRGVAELNRQLAEVTAKINAVAALPDIWVGTHRENEAKGPFHIFLGGSPEKKGDAITIGSPSAVIGAASYTLPVTATAATRRKRLAEWMTSSGNALPRRVLANRLWHYHFGAGIVNTPSDFGYMGGRPSHPQLLDWLAAQLDRNGWKLKAMHRTIMLSQTYQQSAQWREAPAKVDSDARLLWRFPPRRLSAEEIRDTMLQISGRLNLKMGGPGFRLYQYLQDNVATYVPLDKHPEATYRRGVYHQNARAAPVDLMAEFDQPDCAFATPRRARTTTPLQALTTLNHSFTLDMSAALATRIEKEAGNDPTAQVQHAFALCYNRQPDAAELSECTALLKAHPLTTLCRVLLNTSELIYLK